MEDRETIRALAEHLVLPETRTDRPCVFLVGGKEENAASFFECLREFFPLVFVSSHVSSGLEPSVVVDLAEHLVGRYLCPFLAAGAVHPSKFSYLGRTTTPVYLLWVAQCTDGVPSRTEADRVEWLKSLVGADRYYLIDASQDFYPQIYSLPFLPGPRR